MLPPGEGSQSQVAELKDTARNPILEEKEKPGPGDIILTLLQIGAKVTLLYIPFVLKPLCMGFFSLNAKNTNKC